MKTEFFRALEKKANGPDAPGGVRLYASLSTFLSLTSLRFGDVRCVRDIWVNNTALCGISTSSKDKGGALANWATPLAGLVAPATEWWKPLTRHWARIIPETGRSHSLAPHVNAGWEVDINLDETIAAAHAQVSRTEAVLGFKNQRIYIRLEIGRRGALIILYISQRGARTTWSLGARGRYARPL